MKTISGVDQFIAYFGINLHIKTDPKLLQDILAHDFKIQEFDLAVSSLEEQLNHPQGLYTFLNSIKEGIISKHPAIDEFLSEVVAKKLIGKDELTPERIHRAIHTIYLHNCLLEFGNIDHRNECAFVGFQKEKRREFNVRKNAFLSWRDLYKSLKNIKPVYLRAFFVVKIKSVDFVIKYLFINRIKTGIAKPVKGLYKLISWLALVVNIAEAVIADLISRNFANAMAGMILNLVFPKFVRSKSTDYSKIEFGYSQEWSSLYHTWNMAYVTGTGVFHIIHKLINPMVTNSETKDYMHNRVIALNNSLNFLMYNGRTNPVYTPLQNTREIMRLWGSINLRYGKKLLADYYLFRKKKNLKSVPSEA